MPEPSRRVLGWGRASAGRSPSGRKGARPRRTDVVPRPGQSRSYSDSHAYRPPAARYPQLHTSKLQWRGEILVHHRRHGHNTQASSDTAKSRGRSFRQPLFSTAASTIASLCWHYREASYVTSPKIASISVRENALRVCVRTLPDLPKASPSAVAIMSSGASTIAAMSY